MFKSLEYSSLHSLVEEYKRAYLNCGHTLLKVFIKNLCPHDILLAQVRIGELVTHDAYSVSPISWRGLTIRPLEDDEAESKRDVEKFSNQLKSFLRYEKPI